MEKEEIPTCSVWELEFARKVSPYILKKGIVDGWLRGSCVKSFLSKEDLEELKRLGHLKE